MEELANELYETIRDYDPYEAADADWSVEKASEMLANDPVTIISSLCRIVNDLRECLEEAV